MTAPFLNDDRLVDLLIQQATTGLAADEAAELETLLAKYPAANRAAIEQTVVALALAGGGDDEPLPAALRSRVIAAEASARGRPATTSIGARAQPATPVPAARSTAGWWAAAAAVLVAIAGWYPRLVPSPVAPDASDRRAELIARTPGLLQWKFAATQDPSAHAASGDVVWDPVTQRGYLHLVGLDANDARKSQYQLWIFDGDRDDRYPVDGGVFDIPAGKTDVVIPIVVRLHVAKPALFAVTVERPGGVVVSGRERIAVLAKPSST
jgi:anti-sigma-K factor RskA